MKDKRNLIFGGISALTLCTGVLFYVLFNRSNIAGGMLAPILKFFPPVLEANTPLRVIILSFGADFCWAFALPFALQAVSDYRGKMIFRYFLCILLCIVSELLQLFGILGGTFDILDIAVMSFATVLSTVIIYLAMKKVKDNTV